MSIIRRLRVAPCILAASLMSAAPILPLGLLLTGCASITGTTPATIAAQAVQDAQTLATGLNAVLPQLVALKTIPATTAATVTSLLAQAVATAKTISASMTATQAAPLVTQIETDINAAITTMGALPLPPGITVVFQAAQVLLPVIEMAVGLAVPVGAQVNGMSAAKARAILAAA